MKRAIAISAATLTLASPLVAAAQQGSAGSTSSARVGQPPMNSAMRRANTGATGPRTGTAASTTSSTPTNAMTLTSSNNAPLAVGTMNQPQADSGSGQSGMEQNTGQSGMGQPAGYDSNGIMRRNGSPSGG